MTRDPVDVWKRKVAEYAAVCKGILGLSESIRYVGAVNRYGRTLSGFMRPSAHPMLGREEAKDVFFMLSTMGNLSGETEGSIGRMGYVLVRYEKVKIVLIPSARASYIVTIDENEKKYADLIEAAKAKISEHTTQ